MVAHTQNGSTQTQQQTAIAHRPAAQAMPFEPENIDQLERMAERLAKSSLLPVSLRGKPSDVFLTLMTGRELGLSSAQSIRALHIIEGKPTLAADLIVGLCKRSPECVFFRLAKSTDEIATYETERRGEGKTELSFTIQQAQKARLTTKDNWTKYPAAMLRARASAALARAVYPDIAMGLYDPDELDDRHARVATPVAAERVPAAVTVEPPPASPPAKEQPKQPEAIDAEFTQAAPGKPADDGPPTIFEQLMTAFDEAEKAGDETARRNAVTAANRHKKVGDITPDEAAQLATRAAVVKAKINPEAPAQSRTEAVKAQMQQQAEDAPPPPPPAE